MITDFFAATPEEVQKNDWTRDHGDVFPCAQYENVDTIKLATLEHLLVGTTYEEALDQIGEAVVTVDEEGPWIHALNDRLVRALATLTPETAQGPVKEWIATEEWQLDGATIQDVDSFVDMVIDLGKVASRALASGKRMYLFSSL